MYPVEKKILLVAKKSGHRSLLALRGALNMDVVTFAEAVRSLEHQGLLTRAGTQFQLSPSVSEHLRQRAGGSASDKYLQSVSVPQLPVTELYLPDRERFLASLAKSR